jgi:hypothetical protein
VATTATANRAIHENRPTMTAISGVRSRPRSPRATIVSAISSITSPPSHALMQSTCSVSLQKNSPLGECSR